MNADICLAHAFMNVFDITSNNILYPTEKRSLKRKQDNSVLAKQRNLNLEHLYWNQPAKTNLMCFITARNSTNMLVTFERQCGFLGRKKPSLKYALSGFWKHLPDVREFTDISSAMTSVWTANLAEEAEHPSLSWVKDYSQICLAEQRFVFNYISDSSNNNCMASGTNTSEPLKWFLTSAGRGGRAKKGINQQFQSKSNLFSEEKMLIPQYPSTPEMC